jgi:hypothetical protein
MCAGSVRYTRTTHDIVHDMRKQRARHTRMTRDDARQMRISAQTTCVKHATSHELHVNQHATCENYQMDVVLILNEYYFEIFELILIMLTDIYKWAI